MKFDININANIHLHRIDDPKMDILIQKVTDMATATEQINEAIEAINVKITEEHTQVTDAIGALSTQIADLLANGVSPADAPAIIAKLQESASKVTAIYEPS